MARYSGSMCIASSRSWQWWRTASSAMKAVSGTPEALRTWASEFRSDDEVALEATGTRDAIANLLATLVGGGGVEPVQDRAIAEAKVKTDKIAARILAQLLAADFLPPVWLPDERTRSLSRLR